MACLRDGGFLHLADCIERRLVHRGAIRRWFHGGSEKPTRKGPTMLYTIAVILLVLWLLGMVGSYTMGGLIHILLVVAVVMVILNLVRGRRAL
jgi:hypothetical protein